VVTELDHTAIINRIIEIFQADSNLYNADGSKIRHFINGKVTEPLNYPYLYITIESEDDRPFEAVTVGGAPSLMSQTSSYHKFNYVVVIVTIKKDAQTAEQSLNGWVKLIKERLKSNVQFQKPTDGTDPKVKMSHPVKMRAKTGLDAKGTVVAGAVITLQCEAITT
jgi:hypothetical protein